MKVKYVGESFFPGSGLTDGIIYECLGVEDGGDFGPMLRIIDDEGGNYPGNADDPEGYLYSPTNPGPLNGSSAGGRWEIVEDDELGTLAKAIKG